MLQKKEATLSVTLQTNLESSVKGSENSSGEGSRMCWKHMSGKAFETKAEEVHRNKTQTHPVGFVTALTLAAPIEHTALQCYQNCCQKKDL